MKKLLNIIGIIAILILSNSCAKQCYQSPNIYIQDSVVLHILEHTDNGNNNHCYICKEGNFKIQLQPYAHLGHCFNGSFYGLDRKINGCIYASGKGYFTETNNEIERLNSKDHLYNLNIATRVKYIPEEDAFVKLYSLNKTGNNITFHNCITLCGDNGSNILFMSFKHHSVKYFISFRKETIIIYYYYRKTICPNQNVKAKDFDFCRDY